MRDSIRVARMLNAHDAQRISRGSFHAKRRGNSNASQERKQTFLQFLLQLLSTIDIDHTVHAAGDLLAN